MFLVAVKDVARARAAQLKDTGLGRRNHTKHLLPVRGRARHATESAACVRYIAASKLTCLICASLCVKLLRTHLSLARASVVARFILLPHLADSEFVMIH